MTSPSDHERIVAKPDVIKKLTKTGIVSGLAVILPEPTAYLLAVERGQRDFVPAEEFSPTAAA